MTDVVEDPCGICLDKVEEASSIDSCRHQYCLLCIRTWSDTSNTCPTCKAEFTKIKILRLQPKMADVASATATTSEPRRQLPSELRDSAGWVTVRPERGAKRNNREVGVINVARKRQRAEWDAFELARLDDTEARFWDDFDDDNEDEDEDDDRDFGEGDDGEGLDGFVVSDRAPLTYESDSDIEVNLDDDESESSARRASRRASRQASRRASRQASRQVSRQASRQASRQVSRRTSISQTPGRSQTTRSVTVTTTTTTLQGETPKTTTATSAPAIRRTQTRRTTTVRRIIDLTLDD